jgi:hypothetical protein
VRREPPSWPRLLRQRACPEASRLRGLRRRPKLARRRHKHRRPRGGGAAVCRGPRRPAVLVVPHPRRGRVDLGRGRGRHLARRRRRREWGGGRPGRARLGAVAGAGPGAAGITRALLYFELAGAQGSSHRVFIGPAVLVGRLWRRSRCCRRGASPSAAAAAVVVAAVASFASRGSGVCRRLPTRLQNFQHQLQPAHQPRRSRGGCPTNPTCRDRPTSGIERCVQPRTASESTHPMAREAAAVLASPKKTGMVRRPGRPGGVGRQAGQPPWAGCGAWSIPPFVVLVHILSARQIQMGSVRQIQMGHKSNVASDCGINESRQL